ncbi:wurstfest, partial [Carabus blaptoides fortunei]
ETRGEEPLGFGVTTGGIIRLCLHDNIRVDMTLDRAIRVMNYNSHIAVAVSASGSTAALLHPNGNVYQYGSRVEILAYDKHTYGNNNIERNNDQYNLRTSPSNGSAGISTPFVHCTGSSGEAGHLFVRRGERRMHYSGATFIVRNAGHSAGFEDNELKIY